MILKEERKERYICDKAGERADICASRLSGSTRSLISSLIEEGRVLINGKIPKKSDKTKEGDIIEINFPEEKTYDLTPHNIPFEILIDRPSYAVINKPAGLTVHPAPGHYDNTLVNAILYAFNIDDKENGFRPGIVHRLDKDTSGVLLIAKTASARNKLSDLFGRRKVSKTYMAICCGVPKFKEKLVEAPIGRDIKNRKRMAVREDGREAKTLFKVREIYKNSFLAEINIFTGRTHQIRVHSAYIGHPLAGDVLYGGKILFDFNRQALHACKLEFNDPDTNEFISVYSELPEDMRALKNKLEIR